MGRRLSEEEEEEEEEEEDGWGEGRKGEGGEVVSVALQKCCV